MPVVVSGVTAATSVAAGANHTCAVTAAGAVCWGNNNQGQLGDGSTEARNVPARVTGLISGVARVTAGGDHSCATLRDGGVRCWGLNTNQQLGNNSAAGNSVVPLVVGGLDLDNLAVDAGGSHTCAVSSVGAAQCWGSFYNGQLGNNASGGATSVPVNVSGLASGVIAVSAGQSHSCAMISDGTVKCWGGNNFGQLGNNSLVNTTTPVDAPFVLTQTITVNPAAPAAVAQAAVFTVTATASSGLPVSVTASGACSISGNTVTASATVVGNCELGYYQHGSLRPRSR